jgi:aryl-alcohol dehydrogenase-like predicted oxidoreductase
VEYRLFGRSGLRVSELILGAMTFGREADAQTSYTILNRYAELGGNFIDTANVYTHGVSEEIVGKWLKGRNRDDFVIATKVRFPMGSGVNHVGLTRKHILMSVRESLERLGTDYIDLYQVHAWDPLTPLAETMSTLNDLVRTGVVRYLGVSNFRAWQLHKAMMTSQQNGYESFISLQPQYNLLTRAPEYELLPFCQDQGLAAIPWSPLRGGWLSGKYHRGMLAPVEDSRVEAAEKHGWGESWTNYNNERTWNVLDVLFQVSEEAGRSPAQVALNWVRQQPGVTAPIIGARNLEQLNDNLHATEWKLTSEQLRRLHEASFVPVSYPYDEAAEQQQRAGRV